jgi:hypothetical protein
MKSHILSYTIKDTSDEVEIFTDHYEVFCDEEENNTTFQQAQKSLNKLESDYEKESYKEIYCHNISLIVETSEHYAVDNQNSLLEKLRNLIDILNEQLTDECLENESITEAIQEAEQLIQNL